MGSSSGNLMVILFIWISVLNQMKFGEAAEREYTVHDLGEQVIPVSQEWHWTFKEDPLDTTVYTCDLMGANHSKNVQLFITNHKLLDMCDNKECFWSIRDDGIYLQNNKDGSWTLIYPWT
ncbi:hypothetical protein GQ457_07G006650 [Hibiscus cannabinus]